MQGRIERTLLDLQNVIRSAFDDVGDGVAVGGTEHESAQDQHVQSALQHFLASLTFIACLAAPFLGLECRWEGLYSTRCSMGRVELDCGLGEMRKGSEPVSGLPVSRAP